MKRQKGKVNHHYSFQWLSIIFLIILTIQWISCKEKGDPLPTPSVLDETRSKLTANGWNMQGVSVDGVDQTIVYKGLAIQFGESNFTTTNGGVVWPASGTWSFVTEEGTTIKRDDGIEIKIEFAETSLKLTLRWMKTTLGGGRLNSVKGVNVFTLVK